MQCFQMPPTPIIVVATMPTYCKIMQCCQMPPTPIIVVAHINEQWMPILIITLVAPFGHEQMHMCYLQLWPTP